MSASKTETPVHALADTRAALPIALLRAREAVMERFRPLLKANGLTEQQWRVLRVIAETQGLDAGELAARAVVLPPSLTRILRTLDGSGYVFAERDPADKRRSILWLTPEGAALLARVALRSNEIYAEISERIGADRLAAVLAELEAIPDLLSETRGGAK